MSPNKQSVETTALWGALLAPLGDPGGSLKGLYAKARSLGRNRQNWEACMQLQGYHRTGISCGGAAYTTGALPWLDTGSSGRTGQDHEEGKPPFIWKGVDGLG